MKLEARHHAKMTKLVRRLRPLLDESLVNANLVAVGILESLWLSTMTSAKHGDIGREDDDTIAEMIGWNGDAPQLIEILVETGWLDRDDEHRLVIHDWHDHAPNFIRATVARTERANGRTWASSRADHASEVQGTTIEVAPQRSHHAAEATLPVEAEEAVDGADHNGRTIEVTPQRSDHNGPTTMVGTPSLAKPSLTKPNPSPPGQVGPDPSGGGGWEEVEHQLTELGLHEAAATTAAARASGVEPNEVFEHVDAWRRSERLWRSPLGVLNARLTQLRSGQVPDADWPPFDEELEQRTRRANASRRQEAAERERCQDRQRRQAEADAERARLRALESYRPALEALSPDQREALEAEAVPEAAARRLTRRSSPNLLEVQCLELLANAATDPEPDKAAERAVPAGS